MKYAAILLLSISLLLPISLQAAKVNINSANASLLAKHLKGVGDKKARAIIKYRKKHGRFKTVNELLNVKGIGEKILAANRKNILLNRKVIVRDKKQPQAR